MRIRLTLAAALVLTAPAAAQQAAAPDTAALRAALQAFTDRYAGLAKAGDVAGLAATFTEDGTAAYYGFPTTSGRAGLQALYSGLLAVQKVTAADGAVISANQVMPGLATALGTYHEMLDSAGTVLHAWWRWAAAYRQAPDGQWLISYIMAFPDSTKRGK